MPIRARKFIRKMRGGAQSSLVEGEDGAFYVVKSTNNPQHRRILVNEWLSSAFLRYLQIHVPDTVIIELTGDFLDQYPETAITVGGQKLPISPGHHFGSKLAVHPDRVAIYDFLPDALLHKIENRVDFLGTLVFDKWIANQDSRQAVFFRAKAKTWTPLKGDTPARVGFFAQMIDHGFAFGGPQWQLHDSPLQGLYFRPSVYDAVTSLQSFQPWLDMVRHFPEEVIDDAWKQIPSSWLEEEDDQLKRLLENLLRRRARIDELILQSRTTRPALFANWK